LDDQLNQPEAIAWEVWTYLERHRKDTLRCVGSFDAQWKADRFVTEAERNKPDLNLRVHYEVKPIFEPENIEEIEIEDPDAIDVEIYS
jgi:hypothetical protein